MIIDYKLICHNNYMYYYIIEGHIFSYTNHEYYKNSKFHILTIDIVYNRAETNNIFW